MSPQPDIPDPRELGVPRELIDESARTLRHATASLRSFLNDLAKEPAPDTAYQQDSRLISEAHHKRRSPLRWIRAWGQRTNTLVLGNVFDHVLAMERVLEGGRPVNEGDRPVSVWPCVSLSRVVTEGCARICHMHDPQATSQERFARIAAAWLDSCRLKLITAREFHPDRTLDEAQADWEEAERKVTGAGMAIAFDSKGKKPDRVTFGAATAKLSTSLVDILRSRPAHPSGWYRISSGASHNMIWLVEQAAALNDDGNPVLRADPTIITASTCAVLGAFEDVTRTFGTYCGHEETSRVVRTVQTRTKAVTDRGERWQRQMERDARTYLGVEEQRRQNVR